MPARKRKSVLGLIAAVAVIAAAWWLWGRGDPDDQAQQGGGRPPVTVAVQTAETAHWAPTLGSVGTLRAARGVDVTAEVPGQVVEVAFESGQRVDKGAVLIRLDSDIMQAELQRLREQLELARTTLARTRALAARDVAPEADLDRAQAEVQSLAAGIRAQEARLAERVIRAPFAGVLGIDRIDEGQYVQPGQPLVPLRQLSPIRVDFTLPQDALARVSTGQVVEVRVDAWPDRLFTGTVRALEPQVDDRTRTLSIEATLPNEDRALRPGMFVDVRVIAGAEEARVTVPRSAISYNPYGDFVYVLGDDRRVERRFVTTGERRGERVAIVDGLEAGARVVTAGTHKLEDGAKVRLEGDEG